ncbi:MAG: hypothetical protein C5B51_29475 [Terriglobia bacterium]|nr:MAG: hypothetical protein C5B51_29475 [Terriglobia bacterium]
MAEPGPPTVNAPESAPAQPAGPARSADDVALELMKFIAVATGYGRSSQSAAGFSGKPVTRSAEEHAEALLELFQRCRRVVKKDD